MPSLPATRANHFPWRANVKELMTLDTSGQLSPSAFAFFDPVTHSLKTSQLTLDLGLTPSSVILPRSGSMRNGQLYERPTLGRATNETGSSSLLPTPVVNDMGAGKTPDEWQELKDKWQAKFNNNGHGNSLAIEVITDWGKYAPAIARWAEIIGRSAPEPTKDGKLNPALVEWMMGYPEGWTADMSRTTALKALGNAIVSHQAAAAWGHLL
jgi:hypothetical protein